MWTSIWKTRLCRQRWWRSPFQARAQYKQPGDEQERYSGDERGTQSPGGPQWNKLPHTHALSQTRPQLGAWLCICSGLMSHEKAGCDQRLGSVRTPRRVLLKCSFLEPCALEGGLASQLETRWDRGAWHLGWPHSCSWSENTWGRRPLQPPAQQTPHAESPSLA